MLSRCFFLFFCGCRGFVIGLSQISSFFSYVELTGHISFGVNMEGKVTLLTQISFASTLSFSLFSRLFFRVHLRAHIFFSIFIQFHPHPHQPIPFPHNCGGNHQPIPLPHNWGGSGRLYMSIHSNTQLIKIFRPK